MGSSRRGRLPDAEREQRRQQVLDAAFEELLDKGFDKVTMLGIARRAGASKETLYTWFGNRAGLFSAMIQQNADASAERVQAALASQGDPRATLTGFAEGLLRLLTGERSLALNRAAMTSPELASLLLSSGRFRVGPLVEQYLTRLRDEGRLTFDDPGEAFDVLLGLVISDAQIRALLGDDPLTGEQITTRAERAVNQFFDLLGS